MRALAILALVFAILLGLAVAGTAVAKDRLTIGITQYPSTLHPSIDSMLAKAYVLGMTRRPITVYDADWELVCLLCTELPSLENGRAVLEKTANGGDGISVTYTLDPDAVWGDGTPITTRDVLFTWNVGRAPETGVTPQEPYRRILDIDVIDDKAFTLHLDRVTFEFAAIGGFELLPAHLEADAFVDPASYRTRSLYSAEPTKPGLWFGPYRVSAVAPGSHITLRRNPLWWGKEPAFDEIVIRSIENTTALEANLLAGGIDMIAGELGLTIDQALPFEKRHGKSYQVLYQPGLIYEHVDVNLDNPSLADPRVRRALLHAVDRQAISSELFGGRQPVAHSNVNPLDWVHTDDIPTYRYDPEEAARLLDFAGWSLGPDGQRRNAAGEPLAIEIMTTAGNRSRELVQQVLQSQWRQAGIDARIRNQPARVFFGETVSKRQFPGLAMFAWISAPESVPRTTLHSEEIPTAENGYSGQNYTGFANPEVDTLIDAIEVELDREKRRDLWHRLQRIYAEELPALPLYFRANAHILPTWLAGLTPTGHQFPSSLWVENWHVR